MTNTARTTDKPASLAWAYGITLFAAVTLTVVGLFQFLEGLAAVLKDTVFVTTRKYVVSLDLTTWGWIHMTIGVIAVVVGVALLFDQLWARVAGIVIAVISALASFMFLPYYPGWALVVLAFDVAVVWALSTESADL